MKKVAIIFCFFFFAHSREFSNAKKCIQKLFEDECLAKTNSRSLYVDVLFDGYNPFCKDTLYTPPPPPEITTPRRRNAETVRISWRRKRVLITGTENVVTTNRACREKLSWNSFLLPIIVLCRALFVWHNIAGVCGQRTAGQSRG